MLIVIILSGIALIVFSIGFLVGSEWVTHYEKPQRIDDIPEMSTRDLRLLLLDRSPGDKYYNLALDVLWQRNVAPEESRLRQESGESTIIEDEGPYKKAGRL